MFVRIQSNLDNNRHLRVLLIAFGVMSIALGVLYYWFLRETPPFLLQQLALSKAFSSSGANDIKLIYPDWLYGVPSFIHVVAFSFITLSVLPLSKRFIFLIPLLWLLINIGFEVSQALADVMAPLLSNSNWLINQLMYQYIVNGTYAFSDIVAAILGTLFVYVVLYQIRVIRRDKYTNRIKLGCFRITHLALLTCIFTGGILSIVGSHNCEDSTGSGCSTNYDAKPVYMTYEELRTTSIYTDNNRVFTKTGKIYLYQNYLLINSPNEGIHIYDNSDPANPIHLTFINIPGNLDIAVMQDYLYVDSYIDLVTIDIRDVNDIIEVHREIDVFPYDTYQNIPSDVYVGPVDRNKGVVIGYQ